MLSAGCSKDKEKPVPPTAFFAVRLDYLTVDSSEIIDIPTYHAVATVTHSVPNATYTWDLGDGRTQEGEVINFSFSKEGEYTVTLTVKEGGLESKFTKKISVHDKIINKITATQINWNSLSNTLNWPPDKKAGVFVRIYKYSAAVAGDVFNSPVIFQSEVKQDVGATDVPITFSVPDGLILQDGPGLVYGYCLFSKDENGAENPLVVNWASGASTDIREDFSTRSFYSQYSFRGSTLRIDAEY
jgi:PKD repeat protein